jgi:hypothetical protein
LTQTCLFPFWVAAAGEVAVLLPGNFGGGIGGGEPMVTGAGVGLRAFLDCFFGAAEAVGLARGAGVCASVNGSAAIERRVRSESTFCISYYFAEADRPMEGCKHARQPSEFVAGLGTRRRAKAPYFLRHLIASVSRPRLCPAPTVAEGDRQIL